MNAPANFGSIPQELRDLVVDHISQILDKSERIRALSSIALVSRCFRYWAHKRLFAAVLLRGRHNSTLATAFRRLSELKDIIIADPHSETTGIASHIHSFTLSLSGRISLILPLLVEDDALPFIFRKLFRNGNQPCCLSLYLFAPADDDQLDWVDMNHDFRCALLDVVRSTRLSTLRLRGISNLPADILVCSAVNHISFKNISIQHCSFDGQSHRSIQPYSIETDHSFPISHILEHTPTPRHFIFQKLKRLTIKINDFDGFTKSTELLNNVTSIEDLEIKLNCTESSRAALSFQPLHVLRHLRLVHRRQTPRLVLSNGTYRTVQDVINLLGYSQLPRSLCSISIILPLMPLYWNCFFHDMPSGSPADQGRLIPPTTMTIIKRIFEPWSPESSNLKPLDDLFGDSSTDRFAGIRYLLFCLEIEVFRVPREHSMKGEREFAEEAAEYVKSEFFPKVKARFKGVDQRRGGFWVIVLPRFHRSSPSRFQSVVQ